MKSIFLLSKRLCTMIHQLMLLPFYLTVIIILGSNYLSFSGVRLNDVRTKHKSLAISNMYNLSSVQANIVPHGNRGSLINKRKSIRMTLKDFGAIGDGVTDDTQSISKALNSTVSVILATKTKAFYKLTNMIVVKGINRKTLVATGAKILNSDLSKATFLFENAKNITIEGGEYGYTTMPTENGGNSQHVFQFNNCESVLINKIHIKNSPEMGVAITNSNRVIVQNSLIEHTFRDGTYAHYSANVEYINNIYRNIKDDAMSFHDYGIAAEKSQLKKYGFSQATNLIAKGNTVVNAYQGFGSIGANNVQIVKNKFKNTVIAGVAIFNSKELYANGTSLAKNAKVISNTINRACSTVVINNTSFSNSGQGSTGRAAIFIGSLGTNNQFTAGATKRLSHIIISGNLVTNSGAHGLLGNDVDYLDIVSNTFSNCSGAIPSKSLSGDVVELGNVTHFVGNNNAVVDTRLTKLHQHGYALNNVTGEMGNWKVKGVLAGEQLLTGTHTLPPSSRKSLTKLSNKPFTNQ